MTAVDHARCVPAVDGQVVLPAEVCGDPVHEGAVDEHGYCPVCVHEHDETVVLDEAFAEVEMDGVRSVTAEVGTVVDTGNGWLRLITLQGVLCDCGKGVYCPLNLEFRQGTPVPVAPEVVMVVEG